MKIVGVIPARYKSSRFEGKPLADILGKPMIWWVYQNIMKVEGLEEVYVATDHAEIERVCRRYGMNCVMTSKRHPTGVDRLSEVSQKVKADYYVLVQGDEPLLEAETIQTMVRNIQDCEEKKYVYTFKTRIKNPVDSVNHTIIKMVTDLQNNLLFASRSAIPYPKAGIDFDYYKTVGVYAYPYTVLERYELLEKGPLESAEDHDLMRLLEHGIPVKVKEQDTETISVDTPKDLERVKAILEEQLACERL